MTSNEGRLPRAGEEPTDTTKSLTTALADNNTDTNDTNANGSRFVRTGPAVVEPCAAWQRSEAMHNVRVRRRISRQLDELTGVRRPRSDDELRLHDGCGVHQDGDEPGVHQHAGPVADAPEPDYWADCGMTLGMPQRVRAGQRARGEAA